MGTFTISRPLSSGLPGRASSAKPAASPRHPPIVSDVKIYSRQRRPIAALAVAVVLLLQMFLTPWAAACHSMLHAFGEPIHAVRSEDKNTAPEGDHPDSHDCDKCRHFFASGSVVAPSGDDFVVAWQVFAQRIPLFAVWKIQVEEPDHDPGNPRGPPQIN